MTRTVDSYRFISGLTKRMIRSWIGMEQPREIPWTPLAKPLKECTVSLISTAGIALKTDKPSTRRESGATRGGAIRRTASCLQPPPPRM